MEENLNICHLYILTMRVISEELRDMGDVNGVDVCTGPSFCL